jgi:putative transposase
LALSVRTEAWTRRQERVSYNATSALLTGWKKTEELAFLNEVSCVPLTVSRDPAGRWFVSLLCDDLIPETTATGAVGVDAGLEYLLTLSTGEKVTNPRHEHTDRARLVRAQRKLARKEKGSANRAKARFTVARIHARITDRRRDHLHKLTTRLVRDNQTIVIEDLTVRNMV